MGPLGIYGIVVVPFVLVVLFGLSGCKLLDCWLHGVLVVCFRVLR